MTFCYSEAFESLIPGGDSTGPLLRARVVIVGSGYGGSIAAYRLAGRHSETAPQRDAQVVVLERGREYSLGEFPNTLGELPGHLSVRRPDRPDADGNDEALFNFHLGDGVDVLVGSGLGGTSLINANVALRPPASAFRPGTWPSRIVEEVGIAKSPLEDAYTRVSELLEVASELQREQLKDLSKYKAVASFAKALGATVRTAPITVTLPGAQRTNAAGIAQSPCTFCGNCVTGCNVGAKNTLMMNAIPKAYALGAKFYTGARVIRVMPIANRTADAPRWEVHVEATSRAARARCSQTFVIEADTVILSAGTLGSTEILQRSALDGAGEFSPTLGDRFSTNGDAIAMSFGENAPVSAIGTQDYDAKHHCGPTITAVASPEFGGESGPRESFTLEDGAVPASIVRLYSELLTTSAQIARWGDNRLPAALAPSGGKQPDPLVVDPAVIERSQVFLVMGPDGTRGAHAARGRLQFRTEWDGPETGFTVPTWTPGTDGPSASLKQIDALLSAHDRKPGLRDGQYVPNPMWKVVPDVASSVMSGTFPGGRLVTVHPLGGCAMADSGLTGVVNHNGQVFRGTGAACHEGLYVLDGAIVPTSLGVNPFLTIAALSWRASEAIATQLSEVSTGVVQRQLPTLPDPLPKRTEPLTDAIVVRERLVGQFEEVTGTLPEAQFPGWERWKGECGLILQVESEAGSTDDLLTTNNAVRVRVKLYTNPVDAESVRRRRQDGVPDEDLLPEKLVAEGDGTVTFMQAAFPSGTLERWKRTFNAFRAYLRRRQSLLSLVFDQRDMKSESMESLVNIVKALKNVAEMHSTYRDFDYRLNLRPKAGGPVLTFAGLKRVAWTVDNPRLWQSLLEIAPEVTVKELGFKARARLRVDMRFLFGSGLISAAPGASLPAAIATCGSLIARFARSILQASFWEFGSPQYPEKAIDCRPQLPPTLKDGTPLQTFPFNVPKREPGGATLVLKLHRYGDGSGKPLLLVHGLAQGSLIYVDRALEHSMADYFHSSGYDVWLLDYRLSNLFTAAEVPFNGWTIDEIGRFDIPLAVAEVLSHYDPPKKLHVFAHCVGAIGMTMAILSKHLDSSRLESVVLNAIHPWTIPSPANAARAKLAVFYRDAVGDEFFDPIIQSKDKVSATQSLQDRLAFSLARLGENEGAHHRKDDDAFSNSICDRMTFLYGRMWRHPNVKRVHGSWKDLVGRSPGAVQRHLFYSLIRERVLDHEGLNTYLIDKNLEHWRGIRTLFMHGEESSVFNPQSASRSAFRMDAALNSSGEKRTPIGLRRVPGYGHMDVILADDAADKSFEYIHHFFAGAFDESENFPSTGTPQLSLDVIRDDGTSPAKREPQTGPVMRAALIDKGVLRVRFWLEKPTMNTATMGALQVRGQAISSRALPPTNLESQYQWFDATFDPNQPVHAEVIVKARGSGMAIPLESADASVQQLSWQRRLVARSDGKALEDCYFIVASCLYTGTPFDRDLGAGIFGGIRNMLVNDVDCDLLFLVGDQIYADATAGLLDPVAWRDRYTDRYRDAFNAKTVHDVLSSIPCHFAVDDHEFADNYMGTVPATSFQKYEAWLEDAPARAMRSGSIDADQFAFARKMARSYQSSGRDVIGFGDAPEPPVGTLWYALDHTSEVRCPAFILDTRSERERASNGDPARLMSDIQMTALLDWLRSVHDDSRPKFIFAGSAVAPLSRGAEREGVWMREDGLAGYPKELGRIVSFIANKGIERVVFVAGDLHLSCTAKLTLESAEGKVVEALQIVSSALYAPLPFANMDVRQIAWGKAGLIAADGAKIRYQPTLLASGPPHFVRVGARMNGSAGWEIIAEARGADGETFADHRHQL